MIQIAGDRTFDRAISEIFYIAGSRGISIDSKETGFLQRLKVLMQYFRKKPGFCLISASLPSSYPPQMQLLGRDANADANTLGIQTVPKAKREGKTDTAIASFLAMTKKIVNPSGLTRTARQHQLSSAVSISGVWKKEFFGTLFDKIRSRMFLDSMTIWYVIPKVSGSHRRIYGKFLAIILYGVIIPKV